MAAHTVTAVRTAVVGATGYVGAELVRWIAQHPHLNLVAASSTTEAGQPLSSLYPSLTGTAADVTLCTYDELLAHNPELVFMAVPHTTAMQTVEHLLDLGKTVIDMSADFRLGDPAHYPQWYGVEHLAPHVLGIAVYGLPEVTRAELAGAKLVACAGCYPTATALAAVPLLEQFTVTGPVIVDAKSGVSGAGRSASAATHFCAVDESVRAYKSTVHQHTPEMEQVLSGAAGWPVSVSFTPHLVPLKRGLLSNVYLSLSAGSAGIEPSPQSVHAAVAARYAAEPFVSVLPYGQMPATAAVAHSNRAQIGVAFDQRTGIAVVSCAIDNLGKGAASQGIQVANAVFGWPETTGLEAVGGVV